MNHSKLLSLFLLICSCALTFAQTITEKPLPHYLTDEEKEQLKTYQPPVSLTRGTNPPPTPVRTMAEWEELDGIQITWTSFPSIHRQIVDAAQEEGKVYIVCSDSNQVKNNLTANGIPLSNTVYLEEPFNSIWCRDYGPWTVYTSETDTMRIVDWIYNRPRPLDDATPVAIANLLNVPIHETTQSPNNLVATGGNFMVDGHGTAFSSNLILDENSSKTKTEIDGILNSYMGIDRYINMTNLPYDVIHHIDMHIKLLDEETLLVGEYPPGVADGPQIEANLQYILNNFQTCYGRPYKVVRIPMPPENGQYPNTNGDYRTYTNSVIINKTVIVPTYEMQYDTTALRIYENAMPGYNIVGINCNAIIPLSGAIHCITKEIGVKEPLWISHAKILEGSSTTGYDVTAKIKTQSGVSGASVFWSTDTTQGFTELPMTPTQNDSFYAQIPSQTWGTEIHYYISATSNSGKTISKPLVAPEGHWIFEATGIPPQVGLSAPNGGEIWEAGTTQDIAWVSFDADFVNLEYTTNGTDWIEIANNLPTNFGGTYSWTVPNVSSSDCKVRVLYTNDTSISDESDNTFQITFPSITLTSPNGNENWEVNSEQEILWQSTDIAEILLEYTTNETDWTTIDTVYANLGTFNWVIPNTPSETCKVRVSALGFPSLNDESDDTFTIEEGILPTLTLTSPGGGENWESGTQEVISWTSSDVDSVRLEYTTDGTDWIWISDGSTIFTSFEWLVPMVNSSQCKVRISDLHNPNLNDESELFTIEIPENNFTTLVLPNGGEQWQAFTEQEIVFLTNQVSEVNLEYTTNGADWNLIAENVSATTGTYTWEVPNNATTTCKVRISDSNDQTIFDESDQNFEIIGASITLLTPNGNENLTYKSVQEISWESTNVQTVVLQYTINGTEWNSIDTVAATLDDYNWVVPNTPSTTCKVRVMDFEHNSLFDESDENFTILESSVKILSPNGGENFRIATEQEIFFQIQNVSSIRFDLVTESNTWLVKSFQNLASGNHAFVWTVPNIASDECKIKISAENLNGIFDESDEAFQISPIYVYPGDANDDGIVNLNDVSAIQTFFNTEGSKRTGRNSDWGAQPLLEIWTPFESCFADCNGDGKVDEKDVEAIVTNWNATKENGVPANVDKEAASKEILEFVQTQPTSAMTSAMEVFVVDFMKNSLGIELNYELAQNFPNPFNPKTEIKFFLPSEEKVTLKVFNANGQLVKNLFSGVGTVGNNFVTWDGTDENGKLVSSGIYFYRVEAGSFNKVKKMTLIK